MAQDINPKTKEKYWTRLTSLSLVREEEGTLTDSPTKFMANKERTDPNSSYSRQLGTEGCGGNELLSEYVYIQY